jgi:N-hydroxyarylamine O-acetyltransferase
MTPQAYLDRIHYQQSIEPNLETLAALQTAHLLAVPFENLDIHLGRKIVLDHEKIFQKIVEDKRGGFCYELNGLFSWLLQALGFDVTLISARVYNHEKQQLGIEFDHLTQYVTLDGEKWLVDVGFGHSFAMPLRIETDAVQSSGAVHYHIQQDAPFFMLRIKEGEKGWYDRYQFTLTPRQYHQFADGCHYHQTSPNTTFTQGRLCSQAKPNGRITLTDQLLITTQNGVRQETAVSDNHHFAQLLKTHFDIALHWS